VSDARRELGLAGEQLAEAHLRKLGYRTIARRYATPVGELDLVMRDGDTIVFVEVKTVRDARLADPHERLRPAQQRHLLKAARWFLEHRRWTDRPCRYDVVGVTLSPPAPPHIEHFPDAFAPDHW
jgi:putative endonuclease